MITPNSQTPDIRETIVEMVELDRELRTSLTQKIASLEQEKTTLLGKVEQLQKAAEKDEDVVEVSRNRLAGVLSELAETGWISKDAAVAFSDKADFSPALEALAHIATVTRKRGPIGEIEQKEASLASRPDADEQHRESNQVYEAGIARLRARLGS